MPPKKAGGKKGKKKGKGEVDADAAFNEYLQEVFFVAPQTREKQAGGLKKKIKAAYEIFLNDLTEGMVQQKDLPNVLHALGLNCTKSQLKMIAPLVADESDTGNFVVYEKLEPLLVQLLVSKELKYTVDAADGLAPVAKSELIYTDSEATVMAAFDAIWQHQGGKRDADGTKIIDAEPLRTLLTERGGDERFEDEEGDAMVQALSDGDMGYIKEDHFARCILGEDV